MGKGEIAHNEEFLLFPLHFYLFGGTFGHFHRTWHCHLQTLSVWKSLKFVFWESICRWQRKCYSAISFGKGRKHFGNERKSCIRAFSPFSQMFTKVSFPVQLKLGFVNPFPHSDTFWCPRETSVLKTQWEKEKLLITSNFSFFHSVFYPFG